jgi:hypothetical protein
MMSAKAGSAILAELITKELPGWMSSLVSASDRSYNGHGHFAVLNTLSLE